MAYAVLNEGVHSIIIANANGLRYLEERKLLGSDAYAFVKLIEQEELKLSLEFLMYFGVSNKYPIL
jgi:hypothetical protein